MTDSLQPDEFFVTGGTLNRNAPSYIVREADEELFKQVMKGQYCNILTSRQMGKSSLMIRTADRLRNEGVKTVIIDLTLIGSEGVTANEWYLTMSAEIALQLGLNIDPDKWWQTRAERSPVKLYSEFLHEVVLQEIKDPIVIFVDEIDSTLKLPFTDDFFGAIRAIYNSRADDPIYDRLTFVLLGVVRPADLIKDRTRTPYNIGTNIDLTDFRLEELGRFQDILEAAYPNLGKTALKWILSWTGGQPYLTQKLCAAVTTFSQINGGTLTESGLENLVADLFFGDEARKESNLRAISDRVQKSPYSLRMLRVYQQLLRGKTILDEERSIEKNELKLTGLVRATRTGNLEIHNQIYQTIFDLTWVKENSYLSNSWRFTYAMALIAIGAIIITGYLYFRQQTQSAEILAENYIQTFQNSNSVDVRLTSLAGLFEIGGNYISEGQKLFFNLGEAEQLALFSDLQSPSNIENELVLVIENIYRKVNYTPHGISLLETMVRVLDLTGTADSITLGKEIEFWLNGKDYIAQKEYLIAISWLNEAWQISEEREYPNPKILIDRAQAYAAIKNFEQASKDLGTVLELAPENQEQINSIIQENPDFCFLLAAPPTRIETDSYARVITDSEALNVRSSPSLRGDNFIGQISDGTNLRVTNGPECFKIDSNNAIYFWEIQVLDERVFDDGTKKGWIVEGDLIEYYIEPISQLQLLTPAQTSTSTPTSAKTPPPSPIPTRVFITPVPSDNFIRLFISDLDCSAFPTITILVRGIDKNGFLISSEVVGGGTDIYENNEPISEILPLGSEEVPNYIYFVFDRGVHSNLSEFNLEIKTILDEYLSDYFVPGLDTVQFIYLNHEGSTPFAPTTTGQGFNEIIDALDLSATGSITDTNNRFEFLSDFFQGMIDLSPGRYNTTVIYFTRIVEDNISQAIAQATNLGTSLRSENITIHVVNTDASGSANQAVREPFEILAATNGGQYLPLIDSITFPTDSVRRLFESIELNNQAFRVQFAAQTLDAEYGVGPLGTGLLGITDKQTCLNAPTLSTPEVQITSPVGANPIVSLIQGQTAISVQAAMQNWDGTRRIANVELLVDGTVQDTEDVAADASRTAFNLNWDISQHNITQTANFILMVRVTDQFGTVGNSPEVSLHVIPALFSTATPKPNNAFIPSPSSICDEFFFSPRCILIWIQKNIIWGQITLIVVLLLAIIKLIIANRKLTTKIRENKK